MEHEGRTLTGSRARARRNVYGSEGQGAAVAQNGTTAAMMMTGPYADQMRARKGARKTRRGCRACVWKRVAVWAALGCAFLFIAFFSLIAMLRPFRAPSVRMEDGGERYQLPPWADRVFISMNLYNSEDILRYTTPQLVEFAKKLGPERLFFSIYESGSTDSTPELLRSLSKEFNALGVQHFFHVDPLSSSSSPGHGFREDEIGMGKGGDWRKLCIQSGISSTSAAGETCPPPASLRSCDHAIRIPIMATLRNLAMAPLFEGKLPYERTLVLFINDVIVKSDDLARLIQSHNSTYDAACGLDFDGVGLYDTWVARDMHGDFLSPFFPYAARPQCREAYWWTVISVYSCWNGVIAIRGEMFSSRFRSWGKEGVAHLSFASGTLATEMGSAPPAGAVLFKDAWKRLQ